MANLFVSLFLLPSTTDFQRRARSSRFHTSLTLHRWNRLKQCHYLIILYTLNIIFDFYLHRHSQSWTFQQSFIRTGKVTLLSLFSWFLWLLHFFLYYLLQIARFFMMFKLLLEFVNYRSYFRSYFNEFWFSCWWTKHYTVLGQWRNFYRFLRPPQIRRLEYIYKYVIIKKFGWWRNLYNSLN